MIYALKIGQSFISSIIHGYLTKISEKKIKKNTRFFFSNQRSCRDFMEKMQKTSQESSKYFASDFDNFSQKENSLILDKLGNIKPISPVRLKLILLNLVQKKFPFYQKNIARGFSIAESLSKLYFEIIRTEQNFHKSYKIILAESQMETHNLPLYLEIVFQDLVQYLNQHNLVDHITYRYLSLKIISKYYQENTKDYSVIIVAPNLFSPSMIRFYQDINSLDEGFIILRNFDNFRNKFFDFQDHFKILSRGLGDKLEFWTESEVKLEDNCQFAYSFFAQNHYLSEINQLNLTKPELDLLFFEDEFIAAKYISSKLKEKLDQGLKIGFVTHDRDLSQKLRLIFADWGINVNDSNGVTHTAAQTFFKLSLNILKYNFSESSILALLKHPYAGLKSSRAEVRKKIREIEMEELRRNLFDKPFSYSKNDLVKKTLKFSAKLRALINKKSNLQDLIKEHLSFVTEIATIFEDGEEKIILWQDEQDLQFKELLEEFIATPESSNYIEKNSYFDIYERLLANNIIRKSTNISNKIYILTPEEAALSEFDYLIIKDSLDHHLQNSLDFTWLNLKSRFLLGISTIEEAIMKDQEIILDLISNCQVAFVHCAKEQGEFVPENKLFLKLKMILAVLNKQKSFLNNLIKETSEKTASLMIDNYGVCFPEKITKKFRKFSQTSVKYFLQDPYGFYAKYILKLPIVTKLDNQFFNLEFGILLHNILHQIFQSSPPCFEKMNNLAEKITDKLTVNSSVKKIWLYKISRIANFLDKNLKIDGRIYSEIEGCIMLLDHYKIEAKADLIIETAEKIQIIDFKTGLIAPNKLIKNGLHPQLPIEALILAQDGFNSIKLNDRKIELLYIKLNGSNPAGEITIISDTDSKSLIEKAETGLENFINFFNKTDYFHKISPYYQYDIYNLDYQHLSRVAEINQLNRET